MYHGIDTYMNQETTHRRKRVLFLITKATWGGAQRYVHDLATNLPKDAFEVQVAYGTSGRLADMLRAADIELHSIPSLDRDVALLSDIRSFIDIWRCIRHVRPDVVHLNSSKAAALGALAARVLGVQKVVFTVHGWPFGEKRSLIARAVIWLISWWTALLSHTVICVSEYDAKRGRRMPLVARKVTRIYNGISPIEFGPGDTIRSVFPAGAHITGTIGELTRNKNHIALVERASKDPSLYVAIVGEGELRGYLEQQARDKGVGDRVRFFGFIPARDALKGFDTFTLSSLKEGLPYVLIEARMAGLHIEANRVGGVGEILDAQDMSAFTLDTMLRQTAAAY